MKTFMMEDDKNRVYFKGEIGEDEFDKFNAIKDSFETIEGMKKSVELKTPEGPCISYEHNGISFDLIFDEVLGVFIYVDDPEQLSQIQSLTERIN